MTEEERSRYDSDPDRMVPCRLCALENKDITFAAKSILGHLGGKHGKGKGDWNREKYIKRFGPQGEGDFAMRRRTNLEKEQNRHNFVKMRSKLEENREAAKTVASPFESSSGALGILIAANKAGLTESERVFYDEYFETLLQTIDRDEVQLPAVSSLVFDVVYLKRLRKQQFDSTKGKSPEFGFLKDLENAVRLAEERIRKQMDALGLSREAQLKRNTQIKSTPSTLISGYLDEIERTSPESLRAMELEEKRVYGQSQARVARFLLANAVEQEASELHNVVSDDPLSLDDALRRADIDI